MCLSFIYPELINKLIIVDVLPFPIGLQSEFSEYIKIMKKLDLLKLDKQSDADKIMTETIKVFHYTNTDNDYKTFIN